MLPALPTSGVVNNAGKPLLLCKPCTCLYCCQTVQQYKGTRQTGSIGDLAMELVEGILLPILHSNTLLAIVFVFILHLLKVFYVRSPRRLCQSGLPEGTR